MKRLGVIGGLAPASTSYFYDLLMKESYQLYGEFPELLIHSLETNKILVAEHNISVYTQELQKSIDILAPSVEFIVIVCNTAHQALDSIRCEVPIITILDAVGEKLAKHSFSSVGVIGTRVALNNVYPSYLEKLGIAMKTLDTNDVETMDQALFEGAQTGNFKGVPDITSEQVKKLSDCDAVILACTELPIGFNPEEEFDTTLIFSTDALVDLAIEKIFEN